MTLHPDGLSHFHVLVGGRGYTSFCTVTTRMILHPWNYGLAASAILMFLSGGEDGGKFSRQCLKITAFKKKKKWAKMDTNLGSSACQLTALPLVKLAYGTLSVYMCTVFIMFSESMFSMQHQGISFIIHVPFMHINLYKAWWGGNAISWMLSPLPMPNGHCLVLILLGRLLVFINDTIFIANSEIISLAIRW